MIRIIMAITVLGKQIKIGKKKKKAQMVNAIENDFFVGWERERGALKRIDQNLMKLMKC